MKLSKKELVDIILALEERLAKVEALLRQFMNPNTPSSQKRFKENKKENDPDKIRFPGREEGHTGAGVKIPKPDIVIEHTLNPIGLLHVGKWSRTVIDFVDNPIQVTKHIIHKYMDARGNLVSAEVNLPRGLYGPNMQAFVSLLKGKLGASHESIADLITSIRNDLSFCPTTSLNIVNNIAEALTSERALILEKVRGAFYCNADETGLREDGTNGYVWTFCTPTQVIYEMDLSRSSNVPERVLGIDYNNILVVDGWQGYNRYRRQRCWVHLMRELDTLAEDNASIKVQADYFHEMYEEALKVKTKPPDERMDFIRRMNSETELGLMIKVLSHLPFCKDFVAKLENARPYLFTGVLHPEVPLDNNHAERMLRKIVIHRKLMGCIRNEKGRKFIRNVLSVLQTWSLQNENLYEKLRSFAG